MTTALGINNPNSRYNRSLRTAHIDSLPLNREEEIRVLELTIQAIENLRAFNFMVGNVYGARLQAIRLGVKRAELRQMKAGIS